jgi:hypothetical protein
MCDEIAENVGDLVSDDTVIYRACIRRIDLSQDKTEVRDIAFQKMGRLERNKDGLSFRSTAAACNEIDHYGILRIRVGDVHNLARGIEVRFDATDSSHILMRNLPCMDKPEEEVDARAVASELAFRAQVESSQPFKRPRP